MIATVNPRKLVCQAIAVCLSAIPLWLAAISFAVEPTIAGKSIFKASHVPIWCDAPDGCPQYDADVIVQDLDIVDRADLPRWKAFVDRQHAAGKLVCAEMRPLTQIGKMLEFAMHDPAMQGAVCRDLERKPIPIEWMKEHPYQGRVPPFYCSNHPHYQAFLEQQIKFFAAAGVDGVMVDDGGGSPFASRHGGCFCEHCMNGFRKYLKDRYSAEQLRQQGVENPDAFDYRQFILGRCSDTAAYLKAKREKEIPLDGDFRQFLRDADVGLFRSLQSLCSRLSGRHIPMGWDNVDVGGQYAPYYLFWDVFYAEITYQNFHVGGPGPAEVFPPGIVYLNKVADALGKWYTPTPGPRSWQAIMERNLTGLLRQWTAFTYANGGAMRYPRKGWIFSEATPWYYPPQQEFEPIYAFVRTHRQLFDDYEPIHQVGVLYTQTIGGAGGAYYTPLKHVCAELVEQNTPFGVAVAGDEVLANRLTGAEADRFELMLIPEPIRLIDGQQAIVDRWKSAGKAIAVKPEDDVAEKIAGRVKPLVAVESGSKVWLFPRTIPDKIVKPDKASAPLVCHVVNAQYDAKQNQLVKQANVVASFSTSLWKGQPPSEVTYHTIGRPAHVLPLTPGVGKLHVTIPEVDLWGILAFGSTRSVGRIIDPPGRFEKPSYAWTRWEHALTSAVRYANSYQQVSLSVTYTAPDGQTFKCYGFWDGGQTFKIRFMFPATGTWTWKTTCSDASNKGLHEQSGTVNVVEYAGDNPLYSKGYLTVSENKRYLSHWNREPFLWIGDTPWSVFVTATQEEWERYLQNRRNNKFTVVQVHCGGCWDWVGKLKSDREGNPPFAGSGSSLQWNPAYSYWPTTWAMAICRVTATRGLRRRTSIGLRARVFA